MTEKRGPGIRPPGPRPTANFPEGLDHGARWCHEHNRWECVKQRNRGRGECHKPALAGTSTCNIHSGKRKAVAALEGKARIQAHKNVTAWNAISDKTSAVDHQQIALNTLHMSWLRLAVYSEMVRQQVAIEGADVSAEQQDPTQAKASGLIGHEYGAAGKDGRIFAKSEQVRALIRLESEERDRVMRYTKQCHDMGISDRLTALAEKWGDIVANRVTKLLVALDLSPDQAARAPELITKYLGVIDVGAEEPT